MSRNKRRRARHDARKYGTGANSRNHRDRGQVRLDFEQAEAAGERRARDAPFAEAMAVKRALWLRIDPGQLIDSEGRPAPMTGRRWHSAVQVLLAIYSREWNTGCCQASPRDLAATAGCSVAGYYAYRDTLAEAGLLAIEYGGTDRHGNQLPARLLIEHAALDHLVSGSRTGSTDRYAKLKANESGTPWNCLESSGTAWNGLEQVGTHKETLNPLPVTKKPPPPTPSPADAGWAAEEEELLRMGMRSAKAAVRAAKSSGCTIADWLPHRRHWAEHQRRWREPLGVLKHRLETLRPGQLAEQGWPRGDGQVETSTIRLEAAERYDRERAARQQWRSANAERRLVILKSAGLSLDTATRLLRDYPGKAEQQAIAYVAPLLQKPPDAAPTDTAETT